MLFHASASPCTCLQALVNRGNFHYVKQDYDKAKELYMDALAVEADCIEAMYNLGLSLSACMGTSVWMFARRCMGVRVHTCMRSAIPSYNLPQG